MEITIATLTTAWTDDKQTTLHDTVSVIGPAVVPDPDVPVVILLHGMGGSINDLSAPGKTGFTYDMTIPIVSPLDLGLHSSPAVGCYGLVTDNKLSPDPGGWQAFLISAGFITVNYSQTQPWGSLAQVNGQPSNQVRQLHAVVTSVIATFPGRRIAFVTHSRGGLLLRAWLVQYGSDPAVQPRLSAAVQLAPPNHGSELANIVAALEATVAAAAAEIMGDPAGMPWIYLLLAGLIGDPAIGDMTVGSAFLGWLASKEPGGSEGALLELHTFGGTNPALFRWHLYLFTPQSVVPIITWTGSWFAASYHWSVWDVGFPVRNYASDIGAIVQAPPEIVPGAGDILVSDASTSLPWQADHHVHPLNHGQVLWDPGAQSEAIPVLRAASGSPSVTVMASWSVWSQPATAAAGAAFAITVTITNVGTVTWPAGSSVGCDDGGGNRIWGPARASMISPVPRGASLTVTLRPTAPSSLGGQQLSVFVTQPDGQQAERGQSPQALTVIAGAWLADDLTALTGNPPAAPGSALTSWADSAYQHVIYLSADGHVHELYCPLAGGNWAGGDLTTVIGSAPAGGGSGLTSWADASYQHVIYRSADQHVRRLYYPLAGGSWAGDDLTALTGGALAAGSSSLTSWADARYQHVIYVSADHHVRELYCPEAGGSWACDDLTAVTGSAPAAGGTALTSWADARFQHVIYLSADQHVHELYYPLAGGTWSGGDLTVVTASAPAAAGSALTSWADTRYQHVIYFSADQHVHELYYPLAGGTWSGGDLTAVTASAAATVGSALASWAGSTYQHVIYLSPDHHVHELYYPLAGGTWANGDLTVVTAGSPAVPGSALTSWCDARYQHIGYLSPDQHVHEFYHPAS